MKELQDLIFKKLVLIKYKNNTLCNRIKIKRLNRKIEKQVRGLSLAAAQKAYDETYDMYSVIVNANFK